MAVPPVRNRATRVLQLRDFGNHTSVLQGPDTVAVLNFCPSVRLKSASFEFQEDAIGSLLRDRLTTS